MLKKWFTILFTIITIYPLLASAGDEKKNSFSVRFSPLTSLSLLIPKLNYFNFEADYRFSEYHSMGPTFSFKDDKGYDDTQVGTDYAGLSIGWRQNVHLYGYESGAFFSLLFKKWNIKTWRNSEESYSWIGGLAGFQDAYEYFIWNYEFGFVVRLPCDEECLSPIADITAGIRF